MNQFLPLILLLTFALLALVFPLVRLVRLNGVFGIVRSKDPVQSVIVLSLLTAVLCIFVWTVALALLGPEQMQVWAIQPVWAWIGLVLGGAGLLLVVTAQLQMGTSWRIGIAKEATGLVVDGVFSQIRHPIYTGLFLLLGALFLLSPSPWTMMGGGWLVSLISIQARLEEQYLHSTHGKTYEGWANKAGRFIPGIGRFKGNSVGQP